MTSPIYLDESIYSRVLAEALDAHGVEVKRPGVDIAFGSPDEVWLTAAGKAGWIVLMRDQRVRHRQIELDALRATDAGAFVLTAGQATAAAVTEVILRRLQKIQNIFLSEPKPFIYTISMGGLLSRIRLRR